MPASICLVTTWPTALSISSASSFASYGLPSSWVTRRSLNVSLRGRLPTWVVRIRSRLVIIMHSTQQIAPSLPDCGKFCHRHNTLHGRVVGEAPMAQGGSTAMRVPADTIPREYNFAADILKRNLDAGRGEKIAYIDHN